VAEGVEEHRAEPAPAPAPAEPAAPASAPAPDRIPLRRTILQWLRDYFLGDDPTLGIAYVPLGFLAIALFTRSPKTNFIFDEQEALLANPYVRSIADPHPKFRWVDAFYRDFWGLGPERSIGSYRPIPDLVWRALWGLGMRDTPFFHHWVNVYLHAFNGALMCVLAFRLTKDRATAWFVGATFTGCALLTEAVSGVVGIADVLGATGAILAMLALTLRLPFMGGGVFLATLFGLYSKESALACVPLVPLTALLCAQLFHPDKPRRWARAVVAFVAAFAAFVLYVEARRRMFPAAIPHELSVEANAGKPWAQRTFAALMRWYAQPSLPRDPLNNPLVNASPGLRVNGALRVYLRGLFQLVWPHPLSGDYSAPQEPIPASVLAPEGVLGGLAMILPLPLSAWLGISAYRRWRRERRTREARREPTPNEGAYRDAAPIGEARPVDVRPVIGAGLLWIVLSYFPVSNIPVLLPTVRAERFWYFPAIGSSLVLGIAFAWLFRRFPSGRARKAAVGFAVFFFSFQAAAARFHANDYTDDLVFWDATRKAVPRSAKAHLNYSVMKGARGDLNARLEANKTALALAPDWPMASIYLGDTLCRLHRAPEAWPYYKKGFELAPNDVNLVALAMQCLWDEKMLTEGSPTRAELDALKDKLPGSWVEYLTRDIFDHGEEHNGVDPKYRPRGYNEGPKE
jgi:hypothetical protein